MGFLRFSFAAFVFSSQLLANKPVLFVQDIQLDFSYREYLTECKAIFEPVPGFLLVAEVEEGKVKRGYLKRRPIGGKEEVMALRAEEISGIEFMEYGERTWLRTLPLSQETIQMFLFKADSSAKPCRPPLPLSTMKPESHVFKFPDLEVLTKNYHRSETATFTGLTQSGEDYTVEMQILQSQNRPGPRSKEGK